MTANPTKTTAKMLTIHWLCLLLNCKKAHCILSQMYLVHLHKSNQITTLYYRTMVSFKKKPIQIAVAVMAAANKCKNNKRNLVKMMKMKKKLVRRKAQKHYLLIINLAFLYKDSPKKQNKLRFLLEKRITR